MFPAAVYMLSGVNWLLKLLMFSGIHPRLPRFGKSRSRRKADLKNRRGYKEKPKTGTVSNYILKVLAVPVFRDIRLSDALSAECRLSVCSRHNFRYSR